MKPFKYDPAKQERFEQFLREKYHGGLRAAQPFITNIMSETDRARERLDFEAAAEAIEKGTWSKEKETDPLSILKDLPFINDQQFVSSTEVEVIINLFLICLILCHVLSVFDDLLRRRRVIILAETWSL